MQNAAGSHPCMLSNDGTGIGNDVRSETAISTNYGTEKLSARPMRWATGAGPNVNLRLVEFSICSDYSRTDSSAAAQNAVAKKDTALHLGPVEAN